MFERLEEAWEEATEEWASKIQKLLPDIQTFEPLQAMDKGSKGQRKEEAEVSFSSIFISLSHENTIKSNLIVHIHDRHTHITPSTLVFPPSFSLP
jgi:hypothetical protein